MLSHSLQGKFSGKASVPRSQKSKKPFFQDNELYHLNAHKQEMSSDTQVRQSNVDVLIIVSAIVEALVGHLASVMADQDQGAGPAGVIAADWMARFTKYGIKTRVVDKRSHKVFTGQADGLNPRSIEMFQSFNLAGKICSEGGVVCTVRYTLLKWITHSEPNERSFVLGTK